MVVLQERIDAASAKAACAQVRFVPHCRPSTPSYLTAAMRDFSDLEQFQLNGWFRRFATGPCFRLQHEPDVGLSRSRRRGAEADIQPMCSNFSGQMTATRDKAANQLPSSAQERYEDKTNWKAKLCIQLRKQKLQNLPLH